ncbi:hypothetical protein [Lachnoclostridium sp.]|uniref:hypothetical protein n=1 Tax=Lachnoclostridium sp. TaxID=2028282 RepID=UPI0026B1B729|nr:hypothetical protein [Lachnoclostridium sp.]
MKEWWDSLSQLSQVFATVAIPATVVMVLQTILLLFGIGHDHDCDIADHDISDHDFAGAHDGSDGLSLFTIRGIVAFFAIGGWTGIAVDNANGSEALAIILSLLAGSAALFGIAYLFKFALKLQNNGTLSLENAVGKTGEVYIPIPANRKGTGKVMVTVQERLCELSAITSEERDLKTGEYIRVIEAIDDQTVLVVSHKSDETTKNKGGISKWIA